MHHRIESGLRLDADWFADAVALLHRLLVGQERTHVENIGLEIFVLEAVLGLHPLPETELPVFADKRYRRLHQVTEFVITLPRMGEYGLRVFLENRGNHRRRHAVLDVVKTQQQVASHQEVDLAGRQQGAVIHLRPTLLDFHVQTHSLVSTVGQGLVETSMAGLGLPVGGKNHFLLGQCRGQRRRKQSGGQHAARKWKLHDLTPC